MPVPVLGHVPDFYVISYAALALVYSTVKVATGSTHRILRALRDWRDFRREEH
jgi:hypothetical protein